MEQAQNTTAGRSSCANFFVPINLQQIKQEFLATDELDDALKMSPIELNIFKEIEHNVKKEKIKDEPVSYKEMESGQVTYVEDINTEIKEDVESAELETLYSVKYKILSEKDVVNVKRERDFTNDIETEESKATAVHETIKNKNSDLVESAELKNVFGAETFKEKVDINEEREDITEELNTEEAKVEAVHDIIKNKNLDLVQSAQLKNVFGVQIYKEKFAMNVEIQDITEDIDTEEVKVERVHENVNIKKSNDVQSTELPNVYGVQNEISNGSIVMYDEGEDITDKIDIEEMKVESVLEIDSKKLKDSTSTVECELPRPTDAAIKDATTRPQNAITRRTAQEESRNTDVKAHIDKSFICPICQKSYSLSTSLNRHLRTHPGEISLECAICQKNFTSLHRLNKHLKNHSQETLLECDMCRKVFKRKKFLICHLRTHTGEKPFQCEICRNKFATHRNLRCHLLIHTGEKLFQCAICRKQFHTQKYLNTHLDGHSNEKPFECTICGKKYKKKYVLSKHLKTHTDDKPFGCSICSKKFVRNSNLNLHLRTHTGEKPFECAICEKKFSQKVTLEGHLTIHSREKLFQCTICQRTFHYKTSIYKHLRIHSGDKSIDIAMSKKLYTVI